MQLMEFEVKVPLINIFLVGPTSNLHVECLIYLTIQYSRIAFFLVTKLQNKIKIINGQPK